MASLREVSRQVLEDARDAIAWIALYKEGRSWAAECLWVEQNEDSSFIFDEDDRADIKRILAADKDAILVNGYYCNLGPLEEMTLESLVSALRWQYDGQYCRLDDAFAPNGTETKPTSRQEEHESTSEGSYARSTTGSPAVPPTLEAASTQRSGSSPPPPHRQRPRATPPPTSTPTPQIRAHRPPAARRADRHLGAPLHERGEDERKE